jgi:hypothetical protein
MKASKRSEEYPGQRIRSDSELRTDIRIPSIGIRWAPSLGIQRNLLVGFDRPLKLALDTNSLKLAITSTNRS